MLLESFLPYSQFITVLTTDQIICVHLANLTQTTKNYTGFWSRSVMHYVNVAVNVITTLNATGLRLLSKALHLYHHNINIYQVKENSKATNVFILSFNYNFTIILMIYSIKWHPQPLIKAKFCHSIQKVKHDIYIHTNAITRQQPAIYNMFTPTEAQRMSSGLLVNISQWKKLTSQWYIKNWL